MQLTATDVNAALGSSFTPGSGSSVGDMAGQSSSCFYNAQGGESASLQVLCLPRSQGTSDYNAFEQAESGLGFSCTAVSGIGDAAFWCVPAPDGGLTILGDELIFFSGSVEVTLGVGAASGGVPSGNAEDAATQMAKKVVSRF